MTYEGKTLLQTDLTTASGQLRDLSCPKLQKTIAMNAMSVVFNLKITGVLVTRCAGLHHSAVYLVEVSHGERVLTEEGLLALSDVLNVSVDFLTKECKLDANDRSKRTKAYLKEQGRITEAGLPAKDEDSLLIKRFPEVVKNWKRKPKVKKPSQPDLLFIGDMRHGQMWVDLLRKYRSVYRWFQHEYEITTTHENLIAQGKLGVPIPIHQLLLLKVKERLASAENAKIPRTLDRLLRLEVSQTTARDLRGITETPHKTWLTVRRKD